MVRVKQKTVPTKYETRIQLHQFSVEPWSSLLVVILNTLRMIEGR